VRGSRRGSSGPPARGYTVTGGGGQGLTHGLRELRERDQTSSQGSLKAQPLRFVTRAVRPWLTPCSHLHPSTCRPSHAPTHAPPSPLYILCRLSAWVLPVACIVSPITGGLHGRHTAKHKDHWHWHCPTSTAGPCLMKPDSAAQVGRSRKSIVCSCIVALVGPLSCTTPLVTVVATMSKASKGQENRLPAGCTGSPINAAAAVSPAHCGCLAPPPPAPCPCPPPFTLPLCN
jgi:hypothetical protein